MKSKLNIITVGVGKLHTEHVMEAIHRGMELNSELIIACVNADLQHDKVVESGLIDKYGDRVTVINESLLDDTSLKLLSLKDFITSEIEPDKKFTTKNVSPKKPKRKKNKKTHRKK